nr:MAG TPA_asm: hypothetical protein [Caudoviricetes sp.]
MFSALGGYFVAAVPIGIAGRTSITDIRNSGGGGYLVFVAVARSDFLRNGNYSFTRCASCR